MLTFDTIWEKVINVSGYDNSELPQTDNQIHQVINLGIDLYNKYANKYEGRLQGIIDYDNDSESINLELDSTNLLILSYLIASVIASNKVSEFTDVWGTFAKEAGITNYNAQVNARQERQHEFENKAISLIEYLIDTFEL